MNKEAYTRQFLLTKKNVNTFTAWNSHVLGDYFLYTHPKLEVESVCVDDRDVELVLIGYIFDYATPQLTNNDILKTLSQYDFNVFIRELDKYTGQFVVLRKEKDAFYIISDAGAQRELYYTTDFSVFASQPLLINEVVKGVPHSITLNKEFYASSKFDKKRVYIADTTEFENIKQLMPNHYIDVFNQHIIRFFPYKLKEENSLDYVVEESVKRIKGFLKAVAFRYPKVAMPVTAGYDSRLLFAASLDIDCRYFIFKHRKLSEKHSDVFISRELLKRHNKDFEVISYDEHPSDDHLASHKASVNFPRFAATAMIYNGYYHSFPDNVVLDTIMSELARNRYGDFKKLKAQELAYLYNYKDYPFVVSQCQSWLDKGEKVILDNNYNIPDLFYWEEVMGNGAAKTKTEYMLGTEFFSLLNSRDLITLMMSVPIKYRQTNNNILYNTLIEKMSPEAITLPINPSRRTTILRLIQKIRVYDIYRFIRIKFKV